MLPTVPGLAVVPVTDTEKRSREVWKRRVARGYRQRRKMPQTRASNNFASIRAYDKWRMRAFMWLGGRCEARIESLDGTFHVCGENDMRVLQVDHIAGGGQAERKATSYAKIMKRVFVAPGEYQLLCANCHARKHANERIG